MSEVKKGETTPSLGDRNPNKPDEIWALCTSDGKCPQHPEGRFVKTGTPGKLAAAGFIQRCATVAQRGREQNPLTARSRLLRKDDDRKLPSDSIALLSERDDDDVKNGVSPFRCGICEKDDYKQTWEGGEGRARHPHFCDDCAPLAALALKREHYEGPSEERAAIYTKIKSVVDALRRPNSNVTAGPEMPFCLLAEEFKGRYRRIYKSSSLRVENPHFKSTIIFFADMPIGRIDDEEVLEFHKSLLSGSGRCAPLSKATAVKTIETLTRILFRAVTEGWLEKLPDALGPMSRAQRVSGRILTLAQNGNGQKKGSGGRQLHDRTERLRKAVTEAARLMRPPADKPNLPLKKRLANCTQHDLADALNLKAKTDDDKRRRIKDWLGNDCRVREMFSGEQSWYAGFQLAVVAGDDGKLSPEKIVSSLLSRLPILGSPKKS
ncbi:MAG: hypothetical protein ACJ74Q_21530 [Pyrinomonadaceae bacterium]